MAEWKESYLVEKLVVNLVVPKDKQMVELMVAKMALT